jgi:hypothetical protein
MATVLDEYTTGEQRSVVHFLWENGLNVKNINNKMFPVYSGKCLLRTVVHNWVEKFSQGLSKFADVVRPGAEVADNSQKTSILQVSMHG